MEKIPKGYHNEVTGKNTVNNPIDVEKITLGGLKNALSKAGKNRVFTEEALELIKKSVEEPEFKAESLLQTAITYQDILTNVPCSITGYLNAIRFSAYLASNGENVLDAYKRTFSFRSFVFERLNAPVDSTGYNDLVAASSRYYRSKLVRELITASQLPMEFIFRGERYKAVTVLANLMQTAKLDRDKINAAKELLAATKAPDDAAIAININTPESNALEQLNDQLAMIASKQKGLLEAGVAGVSTFGGMKVEDTAEGKIIDVN